MTIKFSEEQMNKMLTLHNEGKTNQEIASIIGTSKETVNRRLHKLGVVFLDHLPLTKEREQEAIILYEKYHQLNKVCKEMHMSMDTLSSILEKDGIYKYSMAEIKRTKEIDEYYFDDIDSHRKAYYLGLLYADGTVSSKSNRVQISLQERDSYILYQFREDLKSDYKISIIKYHEKNPNWQNQANFSMSNSRIHDSLIKCGLVPNKSLILDFPTFIKDEYLCSFILGYMDGDGTILHSECRVSLVGTENFCKTLAKVLADKFGIHCSISYCHGNKNVSTRMLRISGRKQAKIFLDWIYSCCDICLKRKKDIYLSLYCS